MSQFEYSVEDNSTTYFGDDNKIKFEPPAYEQRYSVTARILEDPQWQGQFKKIVEFGCAELRLLTFLRRITGVEQIIEVDIDEAVLRQNQNCANPLTSDYLQRRKTPLRVELYQGSIDTAAPELRDTDVVIGLEMYMYKIEHLYANTLEKVPQNVFGFIQPKLVIFSTPNTEFNVIFGESKLPNGFRHFDHKFEWTRVEFQQWAADICKRFPNYCYAIIGVGKPPATQESIGHLTQLAIFARRDMLSQKMVHKIDSTPATNTNIDLEYKKIYVVDFPFDRDERPRSLKILNEAQYHIDRYQRIEEYFDEDCFCYRIPISKLLSHINTELYTTESELREILRENSIKTEGDFVVTMLDDDNKYEDYDYDDNYGAEQNTNEDTSRRNESLIEDFDENWD